MGISHPFRFGVTLLGAASRQEWITKVHKVEIQQQSESLSHILMKHFSIGKAWFVHYPQNR